MRWIRLPETFNSASKIGDLVKLDTNFASSSDWIKGQDRHTKMVAMATKLYKEQQKNVVDLTLSRTVSQRKLASERKRLGQGLNRGSSRRKERIKHNIGRNLSGVPSTATRMSSASSPEYTYRRPTITRNGLRIRRRSCLLR